MAEGPSAVSEYLRELLRQAEAHCGNSWNEVSTLYRNKPSSYFDDIKKKHNNIMKPRLKDHGGDPHCPINGKLKGVYFGVTLWKGGLPNKSPYGDTRVKVPLKRLFDNSARLYFADFYCMQDQRDNHYVTLVLTKPNTEADHFCQKHLIRLDEGNNVFLRKGESTYKTLQRNKVWVDFVYTDEVDISGLELDQTGIIGRGHSTGGIPKTPGCKICNVDQTDVTDLQKTMSKLKLDTTPAQPCTSRDLSDKELSRKKTLLQTDVLKLEKELLMLKLDKMRRDQSDK